MELRLTNVPYFQLNAVSDFNFPPEDGVNTFLAHSLILACHRK